MKNILIIRLSAMGDVAMTSPIVGQLVKNHHDISVYVLTRPLFRSFFTDVPGVKFIDIDIDGRHKGFFGIFRMFSDIRNVAKIGYVADLHDVLRSKVLRTLFRLSGSDVVKIDKGRKEKNALIRKIAKCKNPLKSTPDRYAEVFSKLGFNVSVPTEIERKNVKIPTEITALAGEKTMPWVGIAPFAKHRGKIYPLDKMETVVSELNRQGNVRMFIFGGGDIERAVGEDWEKMYPNVHSVIKRLTLVQEMEFMANLDVMVSMDSASMHIASLVGLPVVSVWGATHPAAGFLGIGQSEEFAVQADLDCRPCSIYGDKPCFRGDHACMSEIEPEAIIDAITRCISK